MVYTAMVTPRKDQEDRVHNLPYHITTFNQSLNLLLLLLRECMVHVYLYFYWFNADGIMEHLVELETAQYSSKVWTMVLRSLFDKKLWKALKIMLIGVDGKKGMDHCYFISSHWF